MTSKLKTDVLETVSGSGTIALTNQLSGMTSASLPTLTFAEMPVGSVLQVITGSTSTNVTNSTNTYVDTGITATITPKYASSKILIIITISGLTKSADNYYNRIALKTLRDSTQIDLSLANNWQKLAQYFRVTASKSLTDLPNTTAAVTYKMQFMNEQNTSNVQIQTDSNSGASTITLMEIKG
jgi:hypothetical protein